MSQYYGTIQCDFYEQWKNHNCWGQTNEIKKTEKKWRRLKQRKK